MEIHEGLTARTEGCTAFLLDRGNGRPEIPACMGAIGIEGACSSVVGCVDYDVCREKITPIPGKVRVISQNEDGAIIQETLVNRGPLVK